MSTALLDYQHEIGGVLIGAGTAVLLGNIEGLGRATVRATDVDPPDQDGTWPGQDYYAARTVRIPAGIRTPGDAGAALDILASLQAAADDPGVRLQGGAVMDLRLKLPGRDVRVLHGRLRTLDADLEQVVHGWIPLDLQFVAVDPRFYADDLSVVSVPLGQVFGGGFSAPVRAPVRVTSTAGADARPGWVTNAGTAETWPLLRIDGPCTNPTITHVESGRALTLNTSIPAGDWIEIDTRPTWRTVLRGNGGNASTTLTGSSRIDLFSMPAGRSELRWTAVDDTNTCRLTVSWRSAWLAL